ncbi:MAG: hypothetical protein U1F11_06040 [Steroidobacteraceae bacterium]
MSLVKRLVSSLAALLPAAAPAAMHTVSVGGRIIELPVPEGMREVTAHDSRVRALAESKVPAELRLLACFVPEEDARELAAGRPARWDRHVMVVTYRAHEGTARSEQSFASFQQVTDESLARSATQSGASTVFVRGPRSYAYWALRDHAAYDPPHDVARRVVAAPAIVLVHQSQVSFFVYCDHRGDADVRWAQHTGRWLIDAALRANPDPAPDRGGH